MNTTLAQLRLLVADRFPTAMQTVLACDRLPLTDALDLRPGKLVEVVSQDGNLQTVPLDLRLVPDRQLFGLSSSVWHRSRILNPRTPGEFPHLIPGCSWFHFSLA